MERRRSPQYQDDFDPQDLEDTNYGRGGGRSSGHRNAGQQAHRRSKEDLWREIFRILGEKNISIDQNNAEVRDNDLNIPCRETITDGTIKELSGGLGVPVGFSGEQVVLKIDLDEYAAATERRDGGGDYPENQNGRNRGRRAGHFRPRGSGNAAFYCKIFLLVVCVALVTLGLAYAFLVNPVAPTAPVRKP